MNTINLYLPDDLKTFADEQVADRYGTISAYIRDLISKDQDRLASRSRLLDGAASDHPEAADGEYFTGLRERASRL
ncbi:type II toxin-antitoxin system ParD family antitoxin (plasmid) [Ensifer adhaerens]|uniref:ribbon-helix-helix domain-containing protein n=1 Tax=Ensifer adhaerens TaxID=106592 RepID=UPI001CC0BC03|nr:type II toxin-antitoxin system ParD family antitoxin [Ensifer adhaerens]MBZ7927529.1 type II toxin-antitoxin system ParD family antitoxin [Ensifer adhaerens]UAX97947.1 type II toxin-antitoxin system ParD family antitoxin [Ensifer adhaerens]UAY05326.1 type II toxin-antitoxin system ParD family antitoxin [Ensifer adhaerens]UAY12704.1 type II toxin-antitoxin system ParD family antitoxin [Ensifer adhaerens]